MECDHSWVVTKTAPIRCSKCGLTRVEFERAGGVDKDERVARWWRNVGECAEQVEKKDSAREAVETKP